jgi:hypothetical protein
LRTRSAGEAAVASVPGHLVVRVAERGAATGRPYGIVVGAQHGATYRRARDAAVALVRLDARQAIRGDDDSDDAYGHVSGTGDDADAVAGVEAHDCGNSSHRCCMANRECKHSLPAWRLSNRASAVASAGGPRTQET